MFFASVFFASLVIVKSSHSALRIERLFSGAMHVHCSPDLATHGSLYKRRDHVGGNAHVRVIVCRSDCLGASFFVLVRALPCFFFLVTGMPR